MTLYAHHREFREHVKDLSCISEDLCRIVIVDNNPFSFLLQPLNGIPCIPFSPGLPHDDQLLEVILPLLKHLSEQKDVRPVLRERFQMPEWFQNHGIPTCEFTNVQWFLASKTFRYSRRRATPILYICCTRLVTLHQKNKFLYRLFVKRSSHYEEQFLILDSFVTLFIVSIVRRYSFMYVQLL